MARSDLRFCAAWARSGRVRLGAVVLAGLLMGAGCSDAGGDSGLPEITDVATTSASASASSSGPTWTPEQQAVIDGVTAYLEVTDSITKGAPVDMRRLRAVATEPFAAEVGKNMLRLKTFKMETKGSRSSEIRDVKVRGIGAIATVCIDARKQRVMSIGPTPTQITKPQPATLYATSMMKTGGKWRVKGTKRGAEC
jgi:hypothetical protein